MHRGFLIDNDIVLKVSAYQIVDETVACTTVDNTLPSILGVARFVLRSKVRRSKVLRDRLKAQYLLETLLSKIQIIEPRPEEIELAAKFEQKATELSLALDTGESQLLAIVMLRGALALITGDKRAIHAIENICGNSGTTGFIVCFEQLVISLLDSLEFSELRTRICSEPDVDRALSICFSCKGDSADAAGVLSGLTSYVNDLRVSAATVLASSDDLSAIVP